MRHEARAHELSGQGRARASSPAPGPWSRQHRRGRPPLQRFRRRPEASGVVRKLPARAQPQFSPQNRPAVRHRSLPDAGGSRFSAEIEASHRAGSFRPAPEAFPQAAARLPPAPEAPRALAGRSRTWAWPSGRRRLGRRRGQHRGGRLARRPLAAREAHADQVAPLLHDRLRGGGPLLVPVHELHQRLSPVRVVRGRGRIGQRLGRAERHADEGPQAAQSFGGLASPGGG
jgi:hypothetical protein